MNPPRKALDPEALQRAILNRWSESSDEPTSELPDELAPPLDQAAWDRLRALVSGELPDRTARVLCRTIRHFPCWMNAFAATVQEAAQPAHEHRRVARVYKAANTGVLDTRFLLAEKQRLRGSSRGQGPINDPTQ